MLEWSTSSSYLVYPLHSLFVTGHAIQAQRAGRLAGTEETEGASPSNGSNDPSRKWHDGSVLGLRMNVGNPLWDGVPPIAFDGLGRTRFDSSPTISPRLLVGPESSLLVLSLPIAFGLAEARVSCVDGPKVEFRVAFPEIRVRVPVDAPIECFVGIPFRFWLVLGRVRFESSGGCASARSPLSTSLVDRLSRAPNGATLAAIFG